MYSIVPQNVCVTSVWCMASLHSPKSVNFICPSAFNNIFSGFKSLQKNIRKIVRVMNVMPMSGLLLTMWNTRRGTKLS